MSDFNTVFEKLPLSNAFIPGATNPLNRGLYFGDGLFETMIFMNGEIRFSAGHQQRINHGLEVLKFNTKSISKITEIERFLRSHYGIHTSLRIRWNIVRSGMGKYTPQENLSYETLHCQDITLGPKAKMEAYISETVTIGPSPWASCKTLNALPYVMANIERQEMEMDEVILTTPDGHLSEAGSANLFWQEKDTFYTPSLKANCIAGVGRKVLIDFLRINGLDIKEGLYAPQDLLKADKIFTTNITGTSYIKKIMGREFSITPIPMIERIFKI